MKTIFQWVMNPDNNPVMLTVTFAFVLFCVIVSLIQAGL